jgi:hypothetical protein
MRGLPLLAILVSCTALGPVQANSQEAPQTKSSTAIEASTGVYYEEGDYGTGEKVTRLSVPATVSVSSGRFRLAASLPYTRVEGPGNVVTGGGLLGLPIIVDPTKPSERTRREGIGDLTLGASYAVPTGLVDLTLSGEVKLPTAEQDLGTGETDYAVAAEVSKTIGKVTPFVGVGYTMPGDPEGFSLRNSLSLRGGIAARLAPGASGYLAYRRSQSVSESLPDEQQVITGMDTAVAKGLSLGLYGAAGLSDGSPDIGAGIRLGVRLR